MAVYRLILDNALRTDIPPTPGVATGATYRGCNPDNPMACDPRDFETLALAVEYANANGEVPRQVYSIEEAWQFAAQNPSDVSIPFSISPTVVGVGVLAVLAFMLWPKRKG